MDKDLYLSRGWVNHAFVHIQRKRESELNDKDFVILDVRISNLDPTTSEKYQGAEHWEARPGGIWLKRTSKHRESDNHAAITAVDVLFGSDAVDARPGWGLTSHILYLPDTGGENQGAFLSVRRGLPVHDEPPPLHINKDGSFKVLQVSDLHLSTGPGICRDAEPSSPGEKCSSDPRTLSFISAAFKSEKPDLVVLSGDQVNGETAPDAQSAFFKIAELCISHKLPFAIIFGNHDDEGSLSREALMQLTDGLPYSSSHLGPKDIDGVGNYYIEVLARGGSTHSAITLYMLDTHGYSPDERQFRGYDWIKKNQVDWFRSTAQELKRSPRHTGYTHHHMDMAFIHIPLPEYRQISEFAVPQTGKQPEDPTAPAFNSGFRDALVDEGVLAVSCGHDHANDYCSLSKQALDPDGKGSGKGEVWMCYAGGSGFGGYGGYGGYRRRVRVWEFDLNEARLVTWKRVENGEGVLGERLDESILVEGGRVVPVN